MRVLWVLTWVLTLALTSALTLLVAAPIPRRCRAVAAPMQRQYRANTAPMRADAEIGLNMDILFCAIRQVETGGHPTPADAIGDDGKSLGPFQIGRAYFYDAAVPGLRYQDVRRDDAARAVMIAYWTRYAGPRESWTYERLARMHNGGPRGPERSATEAYWKKCLRIMESMQREVRQREVR